MPSSESVRDPESEDWIPMTGPFWWERRTTAQGVTWMDQEGGHEGVGIRDTENPQTEFICSTVYVPDLRAML